ncbi:MAG: hypothetical protein BWX86_01307 [Verrucomicrobia bacterium ADurb.Bin122]|jgi:hypothetical protein|nr:MAG: hypothetical protein BWX86_01307 [Verrucomicrobia bacterium ADurb.Bin122]
MPRYSTKTLLIGIFFAWLWGAGLLVFWRGSNQWLTLGGGSVLSAPTPKFDLASLRSGATARQCEVWYNERFGLRNLAVRTDNQIYMTPFGEAPQRTEGTTVIVEPGTWLFEHHYIEHAITPSPRPESELRAAARDIRAAQEKLRKLGIPLLLVVAPSKAEVYPEHISPIRLGGRTPAGVLTSFERLRPFLQEEGVRYYDGPSRFAEWKVAGRPHLFAPTGTHWSYDSTQEVWHDLRALLNPDLRHPIPEWPLRSRDLAHPQRNDRDLLALLHLLNELRPVPPVPFPDIAPQTSVPADQLPRILWIHDSFGYPLIKQLYDGNAAQPSVGLYYFTSAYRLPDRTPINLDISKIRWAEFVKEYDAIVVVWTEIAADTDSWGFFKLLNGQL